MNKVSKKYVTMWKDLIYFDRCTWMWQREWIQAGKYSSGYNLENFPNLARQANIQVQEYREHHKDIPQQEEPQGT